MQKEFQPVITRDKSPPSHFGCDETDDLSSQSGRPRSPEELRATEESALQAGMKTLR